MILFSDVLVLIGFVVLILNLIFCITMLQKNWDVLVHDQKLLFRESIIMLILMISLIISIYKAYTLRVSNIWIGLVLLLSALLAVYEAVTAFRKVRSIKDSSMELLKTLICVLEAGDPNLCGHSVHVQSIVTVFYDFLPSKYQKQINLEDLKYASLFFDLGKLGIPREILTKDGKLTDYEMQLMRTHPEIGVDMIGSIGSFSRICDWILYHHERVDGNGYHGLKQDEIPLASRIITIADTYSALTMDRTYKASLDHDDAMMEIRQGAGTQFDKELVSIFCEIPKHRLESCMQNVRGIMDRYQSRILKCE